MIEIKRHPLYHTADRLKRAFALNGFRLLEDTPSELLSAEQANVPVFPLPPELDCEQILLEDGSYALRGELLGSRLHSLAGQSPLSVVTCGRVYDRRDGDYPSRLFLEGVYAVGGVTFRDYAALWQKVAVEAFGLGAGAELRAVGKESYQIVVRLGDGDSEFILGHTGQAGWTARALLGLVGSDTPAWAFVIDVDSVAVYLFSFSGRTELYNPNVSFLKQFDGADPAFGGSFADKAADILRGKGFLEFSGMKLYEADAYRKMNMIHLIPMLAHLLLNFHVRIFQLHLDRLPVHHRNPLHQPAGHAVIVLGEDIRLLGQPLLHLLPPGRLEGLPLRLLLERRQLLQKILLLLHYRFHPGIQL